MLMMLSTGTKEPGSQRRLSWQSAQGTSLDAHECLGEDSFLLKQNLYGLYVHASPEEESHTKRLPGTMLHRPSHC